MGLRHPTEVRRSLNLAPDDKFVLVTPGGGGDGYRLVDTYLRALDSVTIGTPMASLIVGGPEMAAHQKQDLLHRIYQRPDWHWLEFTDDLASYMTAADVVVSMGGYNTVGEILTLQRRALVVPRVHPVEEQWIRAQRMAELGLFTAIHPDQLSPSRFAQALQKELQTPAAKSTYSLDLNALPRITETLLSLMQGVHSTVKSKLVA
jgi:predicted glycosyltransferase